MGERGNGEARLLAGNNAQEGEAHP
jgi:hypothetical protein